jgi:hypothetical protein
MAEDSKAIERILKDLKASDPEKVVEAIKLNRKEGNQKSFKALLETLDKTDEPIVEAAIIEFLFDLKDESAADELARVLESNSMEFYNSFLIAAFWQSKLDGSPYLSLFIEKAIEGDYMVCLEALTVVENFDSAFSEEELQNCALELEDAIKVESSEDKRALLKRMKEVIENLAVEGE